MRAPTYALLPLGHEVAKRVVCVGLRKEIHFWSGAYHTANQLMFVLKQLRVAASQYSC